LGLDADAMKVAHELLAAIERSGYDNCHSPMPLLLICHWLADGAVPTLLDEVVTALERLEQSSAKDPNPATAAALHEAEGIVVLLQETPVQAITPLRQDVRRWETLGRAYDQIRALNSLGQALLQMKNSREAEEALDEAQRLIELLAAQLEDAALRTSFFNSPLVQRNRKLLERLRS
jgi:hypothetical protein